VKDRPDIDLRELQRSVLDELESYQYDVPDAALGRPRSDEWVGRQLAEIRRALVKPEWRVVDMSKTAHPSGVRQCVLVADDRNGNQLYYDPVEREFFLASDGDPPEAFGVSGDAVGCFMAR
jgi:hypothetical protein